MAYKTYTFIEGDAEKIGQKMSSMREKRRSKDFSFDRDYEDKAKGEWIEDYLIKGVDVSFIYNKLASKVKIYLTASFDDDNLRAKSALEKILGMKLENNNK